MINYLSPNLALLVELAAVAQNISTMGQLKSKIYLAQSVPA